MTSRVCLPAAVTVSRNKRVMRLRVTVVLVVFAAIVGILAWVNPFEKQPEPKKDPPWFYNVTSDEIQTIQLTTQQNSETFSKKGTGWYFEDPVGIPVDINRWGGVPLLVSGPQSQRLLYESIDDPKRFGLDIPSLIIKVTLADGQVLTVIMGDETPDQVAHYAQMEGFPQLFLIDNSWGQVLARIADEPPLPKWYILRNTQRISGLELIQKDVDIEFTKDDQKGWVFKDGFAIDQQRWDEVLPLLVQGPTTMDIVEERVEDPTPYGVAQDSPVITLKFKATTENGVGYNDSVSLILGNKSADGLSQEVYVDGMGIVLRLNTSWTEILHNLALEPPYAAGS